MIKPISGVQSILPLIDHIVEHKPYLPPLVIGVVSPDDDEARAFVDGYKDRLFDITNRPLVPNAHADAVMFKIARSAKQTTPDIVLLDEIAQQLRSSVPAGAGRGWRTKQFAICLDLIQAAGRVTRTTADTTREELFDWLYSRWEKRAKLLSWVRLTSKAELPSRVVGIVLAALLHQPGRWWFGRRLNRRGLRWFGEHVMNATGLRGDFLSQAVYLLPDSALENITALRRRILFDALLHDVAMFNRRRRFLPHRRRRRWTPVLLLDGTDPLAAELVDLYTELTRTSPLMPLLILTSLPGDAAPADAPVVDLDEAAPVLRALVDKDEANPPRRVMLRLPKDPPADPVAEIYITTSLRVTPRVPGRISAAAPLALTAVLIAAAGGWGVQQVLAPSTPTGCADTKINSSGERVGVIESGCSFDQPAPPRGVPSLSDLEHAVWENNANVDRLIGADNKKRYYREVVFFAPLTRPNTVGRTAPPNAIWQLKGAVAAQSELNDLATRDGNVVPIKLILANSGDHFADGDWVASKIAERPRSGDRGLAAVIGISQSRRISNDAIRNHLKDIPVIGSSMYGSRMTENDRVFLSAPLDKAFAVSMAGWYQSNRNGAGAAVFYDPDPDDYFSPELHDLLRKNGVGSADTDIEVKETDPADIPDNQITILCTSQIPVLINRADEILTILDRLNDNKSCTQRHGKMPILAGPGLIVEAATGGLATRYPWAQLIMTSLAPTAAESEESNGHNAFRIAATAIKEAQLSAKGIWQPALVQNILQDMKQHPEILERIGLPRLDDDTTGRIQLIDIADQDHQASVPPSAPPR